MGNQNIYLSQEGLKIFRDFLLEEDPSGILFFTGGDSFEKSSHSSGILSILEKYDYYHYHHIPSNPSVSFLQPIIRDVMTKKWNLIIAIGGGSVLDCAKIVNYFSNQCASIYSNISKESVQPLKKMLAIPTTSGTGSESTQFATYYDENHQKMSLDHPFLLPNDVILDSSFTNNLPPYMTACTGMDALSQAIESYWSVNSTECSREIAKKSIYLVIRNLEKAVKNPCDHSRLEMLKAANLAGQAIQITRTTAVHALSYPLTSRFGIPHGHAVGLLLPYFFGINAKVTLEDCNDKRGVNFVSKILSEIWEILGSDDFFGAKMKIENLISEIGLDHKLSAFNIHENDVPVILKEGFNKSRVKNNPRKIQENHAKEIIISCLKS